MKKSDNSLATSSKIMFNDNKEHESSSEDEEEIERELADVTFEELLKARSNGSHLMYKKPNSEKKAGRANKNRPMEVSSKKPMSRFREVIQAPKKVVRDPRFESLCGELDVEGFKKRYNFLYENNLPAEREELRKLMKKSNDPEVINDLENHLAWILKSISRGLLRNTRISSHLASLSPLLRNEEGRMRQRTTVTCHIVVPATMNKTNNLNWFLVTWQMYFH
ncbi:rRNA biogenesis protein rrp36 isoform X2 [Cornus florida]|uniref:rRNA biogenesis protein rrp36 isoform X2 n=1 Tax=Cornus florida TaxID=4283 RepID=UPI00289BB0BF|nr:rRNA biogenesis protein rrp36 isoform X2 [Cornus florida]